MSTHRIGRGTVNVSANLLREERDALGRLAVNRDLSISRILRDAALEIIRRYDAPAARGLDAARQRHHREILAGHSQLTLEL